MLKQACILAALILAAASMTARASTSYSVVPTQCGVVTDQPMNCIVDLSPANPLGIYPTMHLSDDLVNDSGGLLDWSTTQGPSNECGTAPCYLGGGVIQNGLSGYKSYPLWAQFCSNGACITEVSVLTIYFEGTYVPASGGGTYNGFTTLHFTYTHVAQIGGSYKWIRSVTGGAVKIN